MNNKLKNKRLNIKRGEVIYKTHEENKSEFSVEEIAKIFNLSGQSLYRIIQEYKQIKWAQRNRDKAKTHVMVAKAIKEGVLIRAYNCEKCNVEEYTVAHHEDYNKPLSVNWLCRSCHRRIHMVDKIKTK